MSGALPDSLPVMERILSRHVTRDFQERPIPEETLLQLIRAACAAPWGGGAHVGRYVVVTANLNLRKIRAVSPGMTGKPSAVIALCLDTGEAEELGLGSGQKTALYLALGAAMQNILLAAQDFGLGGCPIGSFHRGALRILLGLPESLEPVLMVAVGFPTRVDRPKPKPPEPDLSRFTHWERFS